MSWLNPGRWILYLAFAGALVIGYSTWAEHIGDMREAQVIAKIEKQLAAENAKNVEITAKWQKEKDNALTEANKRAMDIKANADKLASVNRGLRNDLADQRSKLSTASVDALRKYASTANTVFGECSAEVERLAGEASGHASDSFMYQASWPK